MPKRTRKRRGPEERAPAPSIEQFVEARDEAKFAEHQELARINRTLRVQLSERGAELATLRERIAAYEHPSLHRVELLLRGRTSLTTREAAEALGISATEVAHLFTQMAEQGYNAHKGILSRQASGPRPAVEHFFGDVVRFGVVSDTHLGNHHALPDELGEAYEVFRREGITAVYAPGNLVDGEKTYRGQEYEIHVMGVENVVRYVAGVWPQVPGITTYHVASSTCHEGYYLKAAGILIGKLIEMSRPDLVYLGMDEADIVLHPSDAKPTMRIVHPGGGSSYAHSYRPQKIVESYSGGEKPTVLVIGHYHKASFNKIRGVSVFQAGCMERQTPFMRKRSIEAHLGFWIIELRFSEHGSLRRTHGEFFDYYVGSGGKILRDWKV